MYQVRGNLHADASGLSTYYPLKIQDRSELATFQSVAVNPSYLSYVDRLVHGGTYNGGTQYQQYTNDQFFGSGGLWEWLLGNAQDAQQQQQQQTQAEEYWSYVDDHDTASEVITFADKPQLDDEGTAWFKLDQNGINNATTVSGVVYEVSENGKDLISLGETYDIFPYEGAGAKTSEDAWTIGAFCDGFDGKWLSLPDGQNLCLTVIDANENNIVYSSPITLNGKECFLRFKQNYKNDKVIVEGVWSGINENGIVDRTTGSLKKGDVIVPRYKAYSADSQGAENTYQGVPYTMTSNKLSIDYSILPDGRYAYGFCIKDVYGDFWFSDNFSFEIDPDGTMYFYE